MQILTRKDGSIVATGSINHAALAELQKQAKAPAKKQRKAAAVQATA